MRTRLVGLLGVLAVFAAGLFVLHLRADHPSPSAAGMVGYTDRAAGFAIDRPAAWAVDPMPDGVMFTRAGRDAVSVRRTVLAHPVDPADTKALRAVTDAVLGSPTAHLDVLSATPTTVDGLPGVFYLYTFPAAGARGAHTHYFVFDHRAMYSLVFQALPDTGFAALAPTFDAMVSSFRTVSA